MSEKIEIVNNYSDLSTNEGFQFEFYCNRCGKGYRTKFKPSISGKVNGVLDTASGLFGGLLGKASYVSDRINSAAWEKEHDDAFTQAMKDIKEDFTQCPRCQAWVCKDKCWNEKRGLCKDCSPGLGVEMSAAQASRSVEEVWAHAKMADEDKILSQDNWKDTIVASCPNCNTSLTTNAKFCPECGTMLNVKKNCSNCGAKLEAGAKFCMECGTKI